MFLRFAYFELFFILVPLLLAAYAYRFVFYKYPIYTFPLASELKKSGTFATGIHKKVFTALRGLVLLVLVFLIPRPQWVDERSKINVEGVDIVISLDLSGSMQIFDDLRDRRTRIQVAKQEAVRFIDKRTNDPISIVIFAKDALSRCPLTLDKKFLKDIVGSLEIGRLIDPNETYLGTGLATAVNRLKDSKAKSKIIILLTDGVPTNDKVSPKQATEMAKEFGVKVYTVGIGNPKGGYAPGMFGQFRQIPTSFDAALLKKIASQTGGVYFQASNPKEMRTIYDKIDQLERTKLETNLFHNYYEAFLSFIWIILLLLGFELLLRLFIWRGV